MRYTTGTLVDLTAALNEAIAELSAPISPADGTLASATSQLNALIDWTGSSVLHADGTLASGAAQYNAFAATYINAIRLYILPVIHLTDPTYNAPAYLPHRYHAATAGLEGVPWAWTTYLLEDTSILIADTTDAQNTILDAQPGVFPIANLDATISNAATRNRIRTALENGFVPGTWINTGMVYRNILRSLAGMFEYHNRVVALNQGRLFSTGGITLSSTVSQCTTGQQATFLRAAQELGINYSSVTGSTTMRAVILLGNSLYNATRPYTISGAGMSMVI